MESSSAVLVLVSSKFVSICDCFTLNLVTVAEIAHFKEVPKFEAFVQRTP